MFEGVQGSTAKRVILYQRIGGDSLAPHGFPEGSYEIIETTSCGFYIYFRGNLLNIPNNPGIIYVKIGIIGAL